MRLTVNPAVKGYLFKSGKDKEEKRDGLHLPYSVPMIQPINPAAPTATRLWEAYTRTILGRHNTLN